MVLVEITIVNISGVCFYKIMTFVPLFYGQVVFDMTVPNHVLIQKNMFKSVFFTLI